MRYEFATLGNPSCLTLTVNSDKTTIYKFMHNASMSLFLLLWRNLTVSRLVICRILGAPKDLELGVEILNHVKASAKIYSHAY